MTLASFSYQTFRNMKALFTKEGLLTSVSIARLAIHPNPLWAAWPFSLRYLVLCQNLFAFEWKKRLAAALDLFLEEGPAFYRLTSFSSSMSPSTMSSPSSSPSSSIWTCT